MGWTEIPGTVDGLRGRVITGPLFEIAAAIDERLATGTTLQDQVTSGDPRDVAKTISASLQVVMVNAVDKLQANVSGEFEGFTLGNRIPRFTRAAVDTELGAYPAGTVNPNTLEVVSGTAITAELIDWWYRALNLFVWHRWDDFAYGSNLNQDSATGQQRSAILFGPGTLETEWNASSWVADTGAPKFRYEFEYYSDGEPKRILKERTEIQLVPGSYVGNFDLDFYLAVLSDWGSYGELDAFLPINDEYFRYAQALGASGITNDNTLLADDTYYESGSYPGSLSAVTTTRGLDLIIKMDVTGGYEYQ